MNEARDRLLTAMRRSRYICPDLFDIIDDEFVDVAPKEMRRILRAQMNIFRGDVDLSTWKIMTGEQRDVVSLHIPIHERNVDAIVDAIGWMSIRRIVAVSTRLSDAAVRHLYYHHSCMYFHPKYIHLHVELPSMFFNLVLSTGKMPMSRSEFNIAAYDAPHEYYIETRPLPWITADDIRNPPENIKWVINSCIKGLTVADVQALHLVTFIAPIYIVACHCEDTVENIASVTCHPLALSNTFIDPLRYIDILERDGRIEEMMSWMSEFTPIPLVAAEKLGTRAMRFVEPRYPLEEFPSNARSVIAKSIPALVTNYRWHWREERAAAAFALIVFMCDDLISM